MLAKDIQVSRAPKIESVKQEWRLDSVPFVRRDLPREAGHGCRGEGEEAARQC